MLLGRRTRLDRKREKLGRLLGPRRCSIRTLPLKATNSAYNEVMPSNQPKLPMSRPGRMLFAGALATVLVFAASLAAQPPDLRDAVELPAGFTIRQVASDELATNVFSLCVEPDGAPLVSGPGYIKRLLDDDGDGLFERAEVITESLRSGAQGMCIAGDDLLAVGDGAIWQFPRYPNRGSTPSEGIRRLPIQTGGEHDSHAIRKGPDGWWYFIVGNGVSLADDRINDPASPIRRPHAGMILRISPDWRQIGVVADGFRNAYDFDFTESGQLVTYDSDGERDVGMPWYRPTRVFLVHPGDDAGWVSPAWKRPSDFFDMPQELGAAGRGSPTGVCVIRDNRWGDDYFGAILAGDWTFGRVVMVRRQETGDAYQPLEVFATARGDFGFAVTDLAPTPDGGLLITVGGRGTRGGLYRVDRATGQADGGTHPALVEAPIDPAEIWPIGDWDTATRQRALSALGGGNATETYRVLDALIGRTMGHWDRTQRETLLAEVGQLAARSDPLLRRRLWRWWQTWSEEELQAIPGQPLLAQTVLARRRQNDSDTPPVALLSVLLDEALAAMDQSEPAAIDFIRMAQLACPPVPPRDSLFDGYGGDRILPWSAAEGAELGQKIVQGLDSHSDRERAELGRLAAILSLPSNDCRLAFSNQFTADSTPEHDLHWLACLARIPGRLPVLAEQRVAAALMAIDWKLKQADRATDRNWPARFRELAERLIQRNPGIATRIAFAPLFGVPGHERLLAWADPSLKEQAAERIWERLIAAPSAGTSSQLQFAARWGTPPAKSILRTWADLPELHGAVLELLVRDPEPEDEPRFRESLLSVNRNEIRAAARGLREIELAEPGLASWNVLRALRRMSWEREELPVCRDLVGLLQTLHGQDFGFDADGGKEQREVILDRWTLYLSEKFPDSEVATAESTGAGILGQLDQIDWSIGDPAAGRRLFVARQCATCHDGGGRLGPSLVGITRRFSRNDLFRSIVLPHEQVADRYRARIVQTIAGDLYRGTVIYESVDGLTLLDTEGETVRLNQDQIEAMKESSESLMPSGLLDGLSPRELADLEAYLQSLSPAD